LHFRVGSPESLAETLATAASRPDLWERLAAGVPSVRTMDDHVPALESIYRRLIGSRAKPGIEKAAAAW
jgi:hypothetical protein